MSAREIDNPYKSESVNTDSMRDSSMSTNDINYAFNQMNVMLNYIKGTEKDKKYIYHSNGNDFTF